MSEIRPRGGRPLTEVERQAFQRLGLTPGHWASLAPAPLFYRNGLRAPNRRTPADLQVTDRLRLVLRSVEGFSAEAGHFWDRLGDGTRAGEAHIGTRLLAWHLATDQAFTSRLHFLQQLRQAAEHFAARNTRPAQAQDAVLTFRGLVDAYLPHPAFVPDGDPPSVKVSTPNAEFLDALAATIASPLVAAWPRTTPLDAPRVLPWLVRILGEPAGEWWGDHDPARRAVERGLASVLFEERWRYYMAIYMEWYRALAESYPHPYPEQFSQKFIFRLREWVDAVRFATRDTNARLPLEPPSEAASPGAPVEAAPLSDPIHPEFIRIPPAAREAMPEAPVVQQPEARPRRERSPAKVAAPFTTVSFDSAMASALSTTVEQVCAWVDSNPRLLFDDCRDESAPQIAVVRTENAVPQSLRIVGDLHADLLTLANIIAYAESQSTPDEPAHFLFLGDFVDRGIHDHETLLLLFKLMMDHPGRVCIVPGNHDIDLQFEEAAWRFGVTIEPAEYCEALNAALGRNTDEDRARVSLARAFIRFCDGRPKAVFLPDGTLVTHGGFPHTDAQKDIATLADLCRPKCIDDFLWARIAEVRG